MSYLDDYDDMDMFGGFDPLGDMDGFDNYDDVDDYDDLSDFEEYEIEVDDPDYGWDEYTVADVLDVRLHDDDSDFGGISFAGETVGDFFEEAGLEEDSTIDELNAALMDNGIRPLTPRDCRL